MVLIIEVSVKEYQWEFWENNFDFLKAFVAVETIGIIIQMETITGITIAEEEGVVFVVRRKILSCLLFKQNIFYFRQRKRSSWWWFSWKSRQYISWCSISVDLLDVFRNTLLSLYIYISSLYAHMRSVSWFFSFIHFNISYSWSLLFLCFISNFLTFI